MVPSHPDRRTRGICTALILASALLPALAGQAMRLAEGKIEFRGKNMKLTSEGNTQFLAIEELTLTQAPDTLISAGVADASGVGEAYRNSTWKLGSQVHVEHHGAVLDAPAATVVFADSRLMTVDVQGAPDQSVRFSHQNSTTGTRSDGSALAIRFETASGDVLLQPPLTFNQGGTRVVCSKAILYNLNRIGFETVQDGRDDTDCEASVDVDEVRRVPPQRQPDRNQAQ